MSRSLPELPPAAFRKEDPTDDQAFYASPRLVTHIDEGAIAALTAFYRATLASSGNILDLMSSWISHLPPDMQWAEIVGHGMNAQELEANPRLTRWFVQDLNRTPNLPLENRSFIAALCCVGVQYLQRPVEVFSEVARILQEGAPLIISFSNRCFPTKAVAVWRALDADGHAELVQLYLKRAGFGNVQVHVLADGGSSDPLTAVVGYAPSLIPNTRS